MEGQISELIILSDKNSSITRVVANFSEVNIENSPSFPEIRGFSGFLNFERTLGYLDFYNEDFSLPSLSYFLMSGDFLGVEEGLPTKLMVKM